MESRIALMEKVLDGLLEEVVQIGERIKAKGVVPRDICELCKVDDKRVLGEFSNNEKVSEFIKWLKQMKIIAVEKREYETSIYFKTSQKLQRAKADNQDDSGYVYSRYASRFYKPLRDFISKFERIETCPHVKNEPYALKIGFQSSVDMLGVPTRLLKKKIIFKLFLCCEDCRNLMTNTMCDRVRKHGFIYDYQCLLEDILLRKRLNNNGIAFNDLEEEERSEYTIVSFPLWHTSIYYLERYSIIVILSKYRMGTRIEERLKDIAKYLKPELIVVSDDHSNLPSYLEFGTNLLFYDREGLFFFDKDREPEEDLSIICEKLVSNLNDYIEKQRGKEHDRIVSTLFRIGQELGYVPHQEYMKAGVRLDCVWFDREGKIEVASEVETTSTWKKDLISTWEVEPKLAIIVGLPKTDKVTQNLMESSLMKSIPHHVLYINKQTDHAFLFNKQKIVKYYSLAKVKEEDTRSSVVREL